MKHVFRRSFVVFVAVLMISEILFAQSDLGTISGLVRDPSGASVPGAMVTIKNPAGIERRATTNESGLYTVTNIPPGFRVSQQRSCVSPPIVSSTMSTSLRTSSKRVV